MSLPTACPDCLSELRFCDVHQKHEKALWDVIEYKDKYNTLEFQVALNTARLNDLKG